ncbi:hypothetical protein [Weissella viridescens]|uniref:hypothetical protein n=1 Tax=Weissella viridescens TaxID=1629 RepID=UPI003AF2762B
MAQVFFPAFSIFMLADPVYHPGLRSLRVSLGYENGTQRCYPKFLCMKTRT